MSPNEAAEKKPCATCTAIVMSVVAFAAFFAGAWADGFMARMALNNQQSSETMTPSQQIVMPAAPVSPNAGMPAQGSEQPVQTTSVTSAPKQTMDMPKQVYVAPPPTPIPPPRTQAPPLPIGPKQCTVMSVCGGRDRDADGTGDDVMVQDASCNLSPTGTTCTYGCNTGTCRSQPGGVAEISVTPKSVHIGETVRVSWSATGMVPDSCSVKNLSPSIDDQWKGNEGSHTSSPIKEKTPYQLTCTQPSGVPYSTFATVEILK